MQKLSEHPDYKAYAEAFQALKARLIPHYGKKRIEGLELFIDSTVDNAQYDMKTNRMSFHPALLRRMPVNTFVEVVGHEMSHALLQHALFPNFRKGQSKINECVSDQFGAYFGFGGQATSGFFAALPGKGRGWFVSTHPDHSDRSEMLDREDVMSKIPGSVTFGPSCRVVRVVDIQDRNTPVTYYTAQAASMSWGASVVPGLHQSVQIHGLLDLNDDDPTVKPQDYRHHSDVVQIDAQTVRFYPNGTGQGAKAPLVLDRVALGKALGEEAQASVAVLRKHLLEQGAPQRDYLGQYSGAPTALYMLHQKLAQAYQQQEQAAQR